MPPLYYIGGAYLYGAKVGGLGTGPPSRLFSSIWWPCPPEGGNQNNMGPQYNIGLAPLAPYIM
jgi:hypothetical protein